MENFPARLKHDSGAMMTLDKTMLVIAFGAQYQTEDQLKRFLEATGLRLAETRKEDGGQTINQSAGLKWLASKNGKALPDDFISKTYEQFRKQIEWIGPVYAFQDGSKVCPLPHVMLINPVDQMDEEGRQRLAKALREVGLVEVPEKSRYLAPVLYFTIKDPAKAAVYELRAKLGEEFDGVQDAYFEHIPMLSPLTATPNDTHYGRQWNMVQIRAGGAGPSGWDITTGNPSVRIAILDTGCDLTHPDLNYANNGFHPATGNLNGSFNPSDSSHGHGTCCAGVAAGRYNNNAGVAGVAGSCQVIPVRLTPWSDANCAAGIRWAADNGAHVISMSFGVYVAGEGFGPTGWNFALIDPQINYAVNTRNCVLVAATGNENTGTVNRYPSRHPLVLAVGASDQTDNRKSPASPDNETWGANFGLQTYNGVQTGVNVVAPGVQIPSTDVRAGNGYNATGGPVMAGGVSYPVGGDGAGDYFFVFNGTSAATPHAAGLAGLIRSRNNTLSATQVRTIIEQTAAKVGTIAYAANPNFPSGTWNQQMGYGRIDVLGALNATPVKTIIKDIKDGIKETKEKEFVKSEVKDGIKEHIKDQPKEFIKDQPKEFIKDQPKEFKESPKEFKEKDIKDIREDFTKINEVIDPGDFQGVDPRILEEGFQRIYQRLADLEEKLGQGRPFIASEERPEVGAKLAKGKKGKRS